MDLGGQGSAPANILQMGAMGPRSNKSEPLAHPQDLTKYGEITLSVIVLYFFDLTAAKVGFQRKTILQCWGATF